MHNTLSHGSNTKVPREMCMPAFTLAGSVTSVLYTLPYGFSVAICSISGACLGNADIESSKHAAKAGVLLSTVTSILLAVCLIVASTNIPMVRARMPGSCRLGYFLCIPAKTILIIVLKQLHGLLRALRREPPPPAYVQIAC